MSEIPESGAEAEVVELCRDLIRIDTSNYGQTDPRSGEREAAEYVMAKLNEVGIQTQIFEPAPGRVTVVAHWEPEGTDSSRDPLLIHMHTDVVPAIAEEWSHDPFSADIDEGCIWGRGAVDMKDMDAMVLAVVRDRQRTGRAPSRPVRLIFFADEEQSGTLGSKWLVDNHPELIRDCTNAISEVGGFSVNIDADRRMYLIESGEKGFEWLKLIAEGTAGHGSMRNSDNPVTTLAEAVAKLGNHEWPITLHPAQQQFMDGLAAVIGRPVTIENLDEVLKDFGSIARMIPAATSATVNPTRLDAGYLVNVIPGRAEAQVDARYVPGHGQEMMDTIHELIGPKVRTEPISSRAAVESEFSGRVVEAMTSAVIAEDPAAVVLPYLLSAGTDAKNFPAEWGMNCYGFAPLKLPADLDFNALFHGVDERVPVDSLKFGTRVLDRFLDLA
jgi:acetylornithine deacetylase/succinyl-diaminopimelate desuccinylase-like protein